LLRNPGDAANDRLQLIRALRLAAASGARIASICTGDFVFAPTTAARWRLEQRAFASCRSNVTASRPKACDPRFPASSS
jgi:hypothetical protein